MTSRGSKKCPGNILKVPYFEKLTFSGIWGVILGIWCCHLCFFRVRYRFLTVSPCSFQMGESNSALVTPTHHPAPSPHTYGVSTHQVQRYLLRDPPLCYESTMLEPKAKCSVAGCKESTQHSVVSAWI